MSEDTSPSTTISAVTMAKNQLSPQPSEEPKKKRAKILSACSECRRKKTKCDGEQPCYNCNKSKSSCLYSSHTLTSTSTSNNNPLSNDKRGINNASRATLEAIESRLKAIEDMLKTILDQSQFSSASSTSSYNNSSSTNNNTNNTNTNADINININTNNSMTLNNFLLNSEHDNHSSRLPSISAKLTQQSTEPISFHQHNNVHMSSPTSPSPITNHEHKHQHLPSPLSIVNKSDFDHFQHQKQDDRLNRSNELDNPLQFNTYQPIKKRKR